MPTMDHEQVKMRLANAMERVKVIRELLKVASISVGVLHENETVLAESVGLRDVDAALAGSPISSNTLASV